MFPLPLSLHLYYNRFRVKYKRILCRFCYFCVISQDLSLSFGSFAQKNALFRQGVFVVKRKPRDYRVVKKRLTGEKKSSDVLK